MSRFNKLSHVIWHCQYHITWLPPKCHSNLDFQFTKFQIYATVSYQVNKMSELRGCRGHKTRLTGVTDNEQDT